MAGTASSQRTVSYVDEVTPGTIATSPAFKRMHGSLNMKAPTTPYYGESLISKGALLGRTILDVPVTGTMADTALTYGNYDRMLESLLQGTWVSDILIDAKDQNAFTIEESFPAGLGGTTTYARFKGVEAVGGALKLKANQAAMLSLDLLGLGSNDASTSALSGATYSNPAINDPMSSGADVTSLTMAGYTLDCFESLDLNIAFDGREAQPRITSNSYCGIARGNPRVTMKGRVYLETNFLAMYNAARASHSPFKVTINLGSTTLQKYRFEMTNTYFDAVTQDWSNASGFVDVSMTATYHAGSTSVVKLTRALA